ncbi:MAG: hypothetical protein OZ913_00265 [Ignavibacteriaceae bacterium]|nr:MAG: hypothetical protein UZ04_CHB001000827 [Chlorobi bacterium OLB4]MBW7855638.1 hypothetical protein [Ignavibacteria bacterium]MEB2328719.1 hypothetical protein [Ignavibacteriaceae bacterium]OQY79119.1 MAG: hypothetical protein B6D43_00545 [Ignavibacteriales bacterium UTCHB1]
MKSKNLLLSGSLGLAHGIADCSSGLLLGSLVHTTSTLEVGMMVLIYNILAFGTQPLIGLLTDNNQNPRATALAGIGLLIAGIIAFPFSAEISVVLIGFGSSAFHVGGGGLVLLYSNGKAGTTGMFTSPGVIGLAVGGYFASINQISLYPLIAMLLGLGVLIANIKLNRVPYRSVSEEHILEGHDVIMIILLLAISLRSLVWNVYSYINQGDYYILLAIGFAAFIGKISGGFIADKVGLRRYILIALIIAAPILFFSGQSIILLMIGVALLQSVTPASILAVSGLLPKMPGTVCGLTLGLVIAAGGLPYYIGFNYISSTLWISVLLGITILFYYIALYLPVRKNVRES